MDLEEVGSETDSDMELQFALARELEDIDMEREAGGIAEASPPVSEAGQDTVVAESADAGTPEISAGRQRFLLLPG
eukprot:2380629-Rhodomonas_salina.1